MLNLQAVSLQAVFFIKQHYLIDIFGGLLTAIIGIMLVERFYMRRIAASPENWEKREK